MGDNDFASLFPWYVDQINRKMAQNWNKCEVDPRTPKGARVYLIFTIHRDGTVSGVQLDRSSGSPTLDASCERGVQRVDTFGNLPAAYNQSTLKVVVLLRVLKDSCQLVGCSVVGQRQWRKLRKGAATCVHWRNSECPQPRTRI